MNMQSKNIKSLKQERSTIYKMLRIYCNAHHKKGSDLCEECTALYSYAIQRIDTCVYGSEKPTCQNCVIHCYAKHHREEIRIRMRYAGPRMIWRYPHLAVMHFIHKSRDAKKIPFLEEKRKRK